MNLRHFFVPFYLFTRQITAAEVSAAVFVLLRFFGSVASLRRDSLATSQEKHFNALNHSALGINNSTVRFRWTES